MIEKNEMFEFLLDSLKHPLLFVDTDHVIRYLNKAAIQIYKEGVDLVGKSTLNCHNESSKRIILDIFKNL